MEPRAGVGFLLTIRFSADGCEKMSPEPGLAFRRKGAKELPTLARQDSLVRLSLTAVKVLTEPTTKLLLLSWAGSLYPLRWSLKGGAP
jgi:hypothetical protein